MVIRIELTPDEQARLAEVAAAYGESPEQSCRRIVGCYLRDDGWGPLSDEDWARSSMSMAAQVLPPEDWSDLSDEDMAEASVRLAGECSPPEDWGAAAPPASPGGRDDGPG